MNIHNFSISDELHFSLLGQFVHLIYGVQMSAERGSAVYQTHFTRDISQEYGPIQCAVPASRNHHALIAEFLRIMNDVVYAFIFKGR